MLRTVVFDVLGTVLDERGSFRRAVQDVLGPGSTSVAAADQWLDEVSRTVAAVARGEEPFRPWEGVILAALEQLDLGPDDEDARILLSGIGHRLEAWPDSAAGLEAIRHDVPVVAMSNAGLLPLIDCSRSAGLTWSAILSSEMVRTAKPDPRVYRFLLETLRVDPREVLFVAAHPWDLRAASAHGMRTAFVQRPGEGVPEERDRFDWTGSTVTDLAGSLAAGSS